MFTVAHFVYGAGSWAFLAVRLYILPLTTQHLSIPPSSPPPSLSGLLVGMNGVNIAIGY
jgi:hypothetical protein